ncbi:NADH dehydrogenase [ubiquinone] 1 alpha subcomplex subunit 13 [Daktulosphaira vitifoliae]|uniref:NADH dehydrogenase [ubiquinone] 1 alpha subcomplex subunit 13 n=1 Tax=Daktulosphaira vitifoliae TaxID=58002 RepID=UPI0021AA8CE3|nr:NADH dehydrogenase [ubiquinone] 1 alpha subcomplex subunit 13 [Daktulosphaira vitifoliae]
MTTAENIKQDLPPKGGYRPISFARVFPKPFASTRAMVATYVACSGIGWYLYLLNDKQIDKYQVENRSALIALTPLLDAEADREYLKQLRRNREAEEELMKNVKGWKTGTLYGEPVYKTVGDKLIPPSYNEYYMHSPDDVLLDRAYWHKYL